MAGADKLYTPELLALAVSLAEYPADATLPLHGSARSKSCGSTLSVGLAVDPQGKITRLGLQVRACAVGQAAAAIFAREAISRDLHDIESTHSALLDWLAGTGDLPDWPGFDLLVPAREYPARHGAIMLPWKSALDALSSAPADG